MFEIDGKSRSYGCVFCVAGKEMTTARSIELLCDDTRTAVARKLKKRSRQGKKYMEETILFPGYVFFEAPPDSQTLQMLPQGGVFSVLKTEVGDWRLYGEDAQFAQWLFSYGGLIPFSKAYQEGERIRIVSGPLKDLEEQILRIDKRNQSAKVSFQFCNREISAWLAFEIMEKM